MRAPIYEVTLLGCESEDYDYIEDTVCVCDTDLCNGSTGLNSPAGTTSVVITGLSLLFGLCKYDWSLHICVNCNLADV